MGNLVNDEVILEQPTSIRTYKISLIVILGILVAVYLIAISFNISKNDLMWILGLNIFLLLFPFANALFSILNRRKVTINQNTIQINYALFKNRDNFFVLSDCVGYFPFIEKRGDRLFAYTKNKGLILKFKNSDFLKLSTTFSQYYADQKDRIDDIKDILNNKGIPNIKDTGEEYAPHLESIEDVAKKTFINQNYKPRALSLRTGIILVIVLSLLLYLIK